MQYEKLSAGLAGLLSEFAVEGAAGLLAQPRSLPLASFGDEPLGLRLFVRCKPDTAFDQMDRVRFHQPTGSVRVADVPLDRVSPLSDHPDVWRLSRARPPGCRVGRQRGCRPDSRAGDSYSFANARVVITTPTNSSTPNGDHQFRVELGPGMAGTVVQGGTWRLQVRNEGSAPMRVDVWSIVPARIPDAAFQAGALAPGLRVGAPGAAGGAITVGAFTTRNRWQDRTGATRSVGLTLNEMADFSSPGPLRNGKQKPDLAAPGAMIVSCESAFSAPLPSDRIAQGFCVNAGTSMSAPFITGLVAALLQRDATLDLQSVKALLRSHSRIPNRAAGTFDPLWGFGLIDASAL